MAQNTESTSSSCYHSGVQTPNRKRKLHEEPDVKAIRTLYGEIAAFGAQVMFLRTARELTEDDYRSLYRLFKTAVKAQDAIKTERDYLRGELKTLPENIDKVLKSAGDDIKLWSQYFDVNTSPTKNKSMKTVPSPTTERIGGLLHAVGSFFIVTSTAICSSKRHPKNIEQMEYLLKCAEMSIESLENQRVIIGDILGPFIMKNTNPGTNDQN